VGVGLEGVGRAGEGYLIGQWGLGLGLGARAIEFIALTGSRISALTVLHMGHYSPSADGRSFGKPFCAKPASFGCKSRTSSPK
jgi:hypothetical protein